MQRDTKLTEDKRRAWTVNLAARRVSLSRSTLYKMMAAGALAYVKVGSRRLISDDELEKLIAPLPGTTLPPNGDQ
jgi:excisionase family DNA binding protein